jgi:excisionase family DNA binding protein
MSNSDPEPLTYSVRSAAIALRIPRRLITDAVRSGAIKCRRAGVKALISRDDLMNFFNSLPEYSNAPRQK